MAHTNIQTAAPTTINRSLATAVVFTSTLSLLCLLTLHFVSPEFQPSWRMVSEYAFGNHEWLLALFFVSWGVSSICLATLLWRDVTRRAGRVGLILIFISGVGEILASIFDASDNLHGLAGLLGVPTLPIGALLVSYHLKSKDGWNQYKRSLVLSAHFTWISLVLMIFAMVVMMIGFEQAGIEYKEGSAPPESVPDGVIALAGYANRIFIIVYIAWLINVARRYNKVAGSILL